MNTIDPDAMEPPFGFAPGWPEAVQEAVQQLFAFNLDAIRGKDRLGSLAFADAPERVARIRRIVRDVAQEPWDELPGTLTQNELQSRIQTLNARLEEMVVLSADSHNAADTQVSLRQALAEFDDWFRSQVRPHAITARVRTAVDRESGAPADVEEVRQVLEHLQRRAYELERELESRGDLVEGLRVASGESAGEALEKAFLDRESQLDTIAGKWFMGLCVSVVGALIGAALTFVVLAPERGNNDPLDFAAIGLGVFIIGLFAFAIRVCAQNYRVNRHLQAVAQSRAAAVATFTRLVASVSEPEIRSSLALALAQAVFATEETGLIDSSGDQVTLIERAIPRVAPTAQ